MIIRTPVLIGVAVVLPLVLSTLACSDEITDSETDEEVLVDPALNGAWVDGVQTGPSKVYITELRFNNGSFEWTFDEDLQERGVYDTQDGVLTVTIQENYGPRGLGDYSRPYSVVGESLTWGGSQYTKK